MDDSNHDLEHPKKRRRRTGNRKSISVRVVFDDSLRTDAAVLSPDLWTSLVEGSAPENDNDASRVPHKAYVALAPLTLLQTSPDEVSWAIFSAIPRRSIISNDAGIPQSTVFLGPAAIGSQHFLRIFEGLDGGRSTTLIPKTVESRLAVVEPIFLDAVYVTVEKGLLEKVDDIQNRFGGGFHTVSKGGKADRKPSWPDQTPPSTPPTSKERITALVRQGLSRLAVVHSGDVFPLPLPSHPITHVRPAPAIAIHCEPLIQGMICSTTRVVIVRAGSYQEKALRKLQPAHSIIEESIEDTAEDTANDQFYSAAEDRQTQTESEVDNVTSEDESDENASHSDASDDSMDDMISMSAPGLPPQQSGTLSAMTAATPRPAGRQASGTRTPGSVYSSFTAATVRAGSRPGKVFRAEPLLRKVPREALHPRPGLEDDEEAFVFVDTSTLAKIGCFSGDWVRIESANLASHGFASLALGGYTEDESEWRSVKIFGISGLPNQRPRYAVDKSEERRSSFSRNQPFPLTPTIYLPPMLLGNMANTPFVKVGVLPNPSKQDSLRSASYHARAPGAQKPPLAKEVTFLKVSTPTAMSRDLQPILFSGLKRYLESRKRILKKGDLVAIFVDEELGKVTFSGAKPSESSGIDDELAARLSLKKRLKGSRLAWFRVDHISMDQFQGLDEDNLRDAWGGVATIDPSHARMQQAGSSLQAISDITIRSTEYWLDVRPTPRQSSLFRTPVLTPGDLPALRMLPLEKRLRDLVVAAISPRAVNLGMPPLVILLHSTQRQVGKTYTAASACSAANVQIFTISSHDLLSENASNSGGGDVKTEVLLKTRAERALSCGPQYTALLLQHIDVLTADRMVPTLQEIVTSSRVLIATTTELDKISSGIRSLFTHELEITAPNETAREVILRNACQSLSQPLSHTISLKSIALQTAALVAGDLVDVVTRAELARSRRLEELAQSHNVTLSDLALAGGEAVTHVQPADFTSAIAAARATFSDAIGAPKIPSVTWSDVGGLATQKDAIMETISLPLTRPELFADGIRKRSGILFYGPPGTGKTLLAKAIATEFSLNFFSVKGPELLNMYIGESEANVRRVFQRARDARPCVVFFDELDSVAPKRGNQGDSGGVMDRIVSQLLAELDGMSSGGSSADDGDENGGTSAGGVFVIGATNRPDLLDPALLRPGRFDKMLYLGVASSHEQQITILQALTRKFKLAQDVDLRKVADRLPFTYTGADLYALCSDAMLKAITRKTKMVDRKVADLSTQRGEDVSTGYFFDHLAKPEDIEVVVGDTDFVAAQAELVGSVSAKELEHFERIRGQFEEMNVGSDGPGKGKARGLPMRSANGHAGDSTGPRQDYRPPPAEQQLLQPQRMGVGPKMSDKGKRMERVGGFHNTAKGKGKQRALSSDDENDDDEDRVDGAYGRKPQFLNGTFDGQLNGAMQKGKGKAKEVLDGFVDELEEDDEGLYT